MPSSLTWIDHDSVARERSLRILSLFQEKESRDELGLGGIRDSFADQLFPGTSTIQTRLRYMFFVPWIYRSLEQKRIQPPRFAALADRAERDLIDALKNADEQEAGILGARTGRHLKRLPSSVYWSGLGTWGIRIPDISQDQYHRFIQMYYRRRDSIEEQKRERRTRGDDVDFDSDAALVTWHARLPEPPDDFPGAASFKLTKEEADFLLDCIERKHGQSLLAHLALRCTPAEIAAPWEHPESATFSEQHVELLHHARLFSEVMHGASIIYNIGLAELGKREDVDNYRRWMEDWLKDLNLDEINHWSLPRLWELVVGHGHNISAATKSFVEQWTRLTASGSKTLGSDPNAFNLVRDREIFLKKARSRFKNQGALDQWKGASGLGRMNYRWYRVTTLLKDLYEGLHPEEAP